MTDLLAIEVSPRFEHSTSRRLFAAVVTQGGFSAAGRARRARVAIKIAGSFEKQS